MTQLFVQQSITVNAGVVLEHGLGLETGMPFSWFYGNVGDLGGFAGGVGQQLGTSRGAGMQNYSIQTENGPVGNGLICLTAFSKPLASAVTISGSITFNIWAGSGADYNVGLAARVYRLNNIGGLTQICAANASGEVAVGSRAAKNWSGSPSSTALAKGDRLIVWFMAIDGSGNMVFNAAGLGVSYAGTSAAADGDTYVTFTEALSFTNDDSDQPAGTTYYLRSTASDVPDQGAGNDEKALATVAGAGETTAVINTQNGPIASGTVKWTTSAGGNTLEWYTPGLAAFTLSGVVLVRLFGSTSDLLSDAATVVELAVVDNDGSAATIWSRQLMRHKDGQQLTRGAWSTTRYGNRVALAGPDLDVTIGQRLRLRVYLDDDLGGSGLVASGYTATLYYNDSDDAASTGAMSRIVLSQTVTATWTVVDADFENGVSGANLNVGDDV